jgi:hypothetical protein
MSNDIKRAYRAHPTMSRFHHSPAFHRAVRGPRGSGKSTGCCIELFKKSAEQEKSPDGISHTRWAIVRNTYRELLDTTVKTWLHWFPEEHLGKFNYNNMVHHIRFKDLKKNIDMDAEFMFRALDRPKDVKKTLSMELTGAYINEAKEVPFGIISGLDDAIGRYPARELEQGFVGPSWSGMILDTNAPDEDHWWFALDEQFRNGAIDPKVWEFFTQPGGLIEREGKFHANPDAENLDNIGHDYYTVRMVGKTKDHIRVYYCNQYGFIVEGKPVHPEYVDAVHCWHEPLEPVKGLTIYVGLDFGLTPAATFGQVLPNGRWHVIDELVTERMGIKNFSRELKPMLTGKYRGFEFVIGGDPSGSEEAQTDERTCYQILEAADIPAQPAYRNNDTTIRREALREPLSRLIDGKPGMLVSPICKTFRKGLAGGFCFKRVQVVGAERYQDKPDKNRYSHVCEAGEYMCLVAGEGTQLVETPGPKVDPSEFDLHINIGDYGAYQGNGWML